MAVIESAGRSARKAKGDGHLRRAEILAAAERIFVECGYEGATIRKIAEAVGVSSTALYMHFREKGEILAEIASNAVQTLLDEDTALMRRDMDPVERMRAMLEVYMGFALEHPHAYQLVYGPAPAPVDAGREAPLQTLGLQTYALFRDAVALAVGDGRLKAGDVEEIAQISWAAAHGVVSLIVSHPRFDWLKPEQLTKASMDALFHGIAA